ncbi:ribonucleotide-diphosphate reductase subunit alpha, partial [Francisella tularensis subsp. holarctica]|uniref:ribonucleotide reductase N-terminal alpha domain-containing protein n=1 Tax=Francisella tularensis TaxID=263 RepID=UPI0023ACC4F5|nr:ribonucleotide-diphosphate reductase subunit alpha [Francisella tularensis subsp. holarctica]
MANQSYLGINIDLSRDRELSEQAHQLLTNYYCLQNEPSPQYAFARAAVAYSFGDMNLAQRIYDAAAKGWFM